MYIAFKWLTAMALTMWLVLCTVDICQNKLIDLKNIGFKPRSILRPFLKNVSAERRHSYKSKEKLKVKVYNGDSNLFHYVMFMAGACMVLIYNKKNHIISFTASRIRSVNLFFAKKIVVAVKKASPILSAALVHYIRVLLKAAITFFVKIKVKASHSKFSFGNQDYKRFHNTVLLDKLKVMGQERKNLGQLLLAAIQENKNIRMRYQLENMAKNRLARHIEDTQKQIKENRTKYVNFQQLYLITHQENTFLKNRLKKITKEKDEAEKNLIKLVNQVCQSKNNDLKAYCSRFIVRTKDNLLNSDVQAEIQQFLQKLDPNEGKSEVSVSHKITECSSRNFKMAEILECEGNLIDLVKEAPKLRGLPGECIWTVKDKEGMIEKLYEYETDFDNGDTIRRIRQYSVYHDKDCLLDFSNSRTVVRDSNVDISVLRTCFVNPDHTITSHKFLTGSPAFQSFLQNNKNIVLRQPMPVTPSLKC